MTPNTWKVKHVPAYRVRALHSDLRIPIPLCAVLVGRGLHDPDQARAFLNPYEQPLHDPFLFNEMSKAVDRLEEALVAGESILLYGDYDVDGVSAVALMVEYLRTRRGRVRYYFPNRATEGYGLSDKGVDYALKNDCSLLIVLDCGIRDVEKAARASRQGLDLIICDHHLPAAEMPPARAIINPLIPGEAYPCKDLSGCALAFKLVQAHAGRYGGSEVSTEGLLDLVALSLAADIVTLRGESRTLAARGLRCIQDRDRPGLSAIWALSGRRPPYSISDIVFGVGPRLNAAGRMAEADLALRCLLARDETTARALAEELEGRNEIRRAFDQRMTDEAIEGYQTTPWMQGRHALVLYRPHWHKGLAGIVAARLADRLSMPTIILARDGRLAAGSGRSAGNISIHDALKACENWLHRWGGHRQAVGLQLSVADIPAFTDAFEFAVRQQSVQPKDNHMTADAELKAGDIDADFMDALARFAPFGPGNRNPRFMLKEVRDAGGSRVVKDAHLKLDLQWSNGCRLPGGIAYGQAAAYSLLQNSGRVHLCACLKREVWRGRPRIQLDVKGIWPAEISNPTSLG